MADAEAESTTHSLAPEDLARDQALLVETVREAGALGLSLFRTELKKWTKDASSPVSEADIAVNDLIQARLQPATPGYGWLSEESADDERRLRMRRVWIVDPIDGTRSYLAGHEDWCVSVALVEDGLPVLGAVFAPASDEFFLAARGAGTRWNGTPVSATRGRELDLTRIAGRSDTTHSGIQRILQRPVTRDAQFHGTTTHEWAVKRGCPG